MNLLRRAISLPVADAPPETLGVRRNRNGWVRPIRLRASRSAGAAEARDRTFRRLLALADMLAVSASLVTSVIVVGSNGLTPAALAIPPLFILVVKVLGLYDRDAHLLHRSTLDEAPKLFAVATATALLLSLSETLFVTSDLTRTQILVVWILLFGSLVAFRAIARTLGRHMTPVERCLFVGSAEHGEELRVKLASSTSVKAELVGWLPTATESEDIVQNPLALAQRVQLAIAERDVDRVILGPEAGASNALVDAIRRNKDYGLNVSVLPDVTRVVTSSVELDRIGGFTLLGVRRFEITRSSRILKRTFDVVVSSVGLLLLSPLLAVIAIAIKLDSPGPVFFRQRRAGRHGQAFRIIKFRSMFDGADQQKDELMDRNESNGLFKIADDPRVTRVGSLIRRRHVDELPQLVNVLRGEMSLVGPRPLVLEEDRRIVGWHRHRLDVRPGITGPWQVLRNPEIPITEMVAMDYQYVADWSPWNDIRILLLTLALPFQNRGI